MGDIGYKEMMEAIESRLQQSENRMKEHIQSFIEKAGSNSKRITQLEQKIFSYEASVRGMKWLLSAGAAVMAFGFYHFERLSRLFDK